GVRWCVGRWGGVVGPREIVPRARVGPAPLPPSRGGVYVECAAGRGDETCFPAGGAVDECGEPTGVGDYGGVAGAARTAEKNVRLVADDKSRCVGRIVDDAGTGDAD